MTAFSANVMPAVLEAYDFSGIGDAGRRRRRTRHVLTSVLREYPQMRGVLFDLDHVVAGARPRSAASGVGDRVRTESGDFFKAVPAGGDAYIMKHIIHDWDDDRALTILQNIRKALDGKPQGRVILLEAVLPPGNAPDFGKLIDLEMLLLPGGRERTAEEFARAVRARRLHADAHRADGVAALGHRSRCPLTAGPSATSTRSNVSPFLRGDERGDLRRGRQEGEDRRRDYQ